MLRSLSDNLNLLITKTKTSANELARRTGVPSGTIKRIRNNAQPNPTISTLIPLAQHFAVSVSELLGEIPLFQTQSQVRVVEVPLRASNGQYILTEKQVSAHAFAMFIEEPDLILFPMGACIIVEPARQPKTGDYVLVTKSGCDQTTTFIRKYIEEIDHIYLKPLVKDLMLTILTPDIKVLGVIVQCKMEL